MREQFAWNFAAQSVGLVLPPLLIIFLARILEPSDFGIFALLMVVISIIQSLSLSPLGEVIIKSEREEIGDFIFSLQLVVGIAFSLMLFIGSDLVANLFYKPELASPLRVSCLLLLISPLVDTAIRMNMRNLTFKAVFVRRVVSPIGNAIISIPLAIYGSGYWALVWGQISGLALAAFVVLAMGGWRPRFNLEFCSFRKDLLFSWQMLLQSASRWGRAQSDKAILGFNIPLDALGQYNMAQTIAGLPFAAVISPVTQVTYAIMSEDIRLGKNINKLFLLTQRRIMMITFPMCVVFLVNVKGLILIILGEKWLDISTVFAILVAVATVYSPFGLNVEIFKAKGKPHVMTRLMIVQAVVSIGFFWWLAPYGEYSVVLGLLGLSTVFAPLNIILTLNLLGVGKIEYFRSVLVRPSLIMAVVLMTNFVVKELPISDISTTIMNVVVSGGIVLLAGYYWERELFVWK